MGSLEDHLEVVRAGWAAELVAYRDERVAAGRPLAWYEEQKAGGGAAATLMVVDIHPEGTVELAMRGDTVAMHLREGKLLAASPICDPDEFGNHPKLILTTEEVPVLQRTSLSSRRGDQLVVATDALAEWLLRRSAEGGMATALERLTTPASFEVMIESEREHGRLHDDDVTLVVVEV